MKAIFAFFSLVFTILTVSSSAMAACGEQLITLHRYAEAGNAASKVNTTMILIKGKKTSFLNLTGSRDMEVKLDGRDPGSAVPTSENETIKTDMPSVIPVVKSTSPTVEAMVDAFLDNVDFGQLLRDIIKFHVSLLNMYLLSCLCRVAIL